MTNAPMPTDLKRRDFLAQTAALGSLLALGSSSADAQTQTPVRGGKLTIAATGAAPTDTLDPRTITSVYHGMQGYLYGNCLTEIGEGDRLVGEPIDVPMFDMTSSQTQFQSFAQVRSTQRR